MEYIIIDREGIKLFTHTTSEDVYIEGTAVIDENVNIDISATETKIQGIIDYIAIHPDRDSWGL